jgi:hypothetical protein
MSMGRGGKWFGENLRPLERWLRSNVGRPWDAVYSEICEVLPADSVVKKHVRDHLGDFVLTITHEVDGRLWGQREWGDWERLDETPAAYKPIDAVMEAQVDRVDVVHELRQLVCVKG